MNLKDFYYYLFYKFYKVTSTGAIKSLASWYASLGIIALEIFTLLSIYNYYAVFFDRHAQLELVSFKVLFPLILISIINYLAFDKSDRWEDYVEDFNKWPAEKNAKGNIIVISLVVLVISNLVFSFYLMSQIDWSKYK